MSHNGGVSNPYQPPSAEDPSPREPYPGYGRPDQDPYGQPVGGYQGYQTQPYDQGYGAPAPDHPQGTLILIFGIAGFFVGVLGPVAWIMGSRALREIRATGRHPANEQMIVIGRILGIIVTVLMVLAVVFSVLAVVLFAATAGSIN